MVCLSRPYPFKIFKGCLPQILLGPFLNALSHMFFKNAKIRRHYPNFLKEKKFEEGARL